MIGIPFYCADNVDYVNSRDGSPVPVEIAAARILRRWAKANGKHRKVRRTVPDVKRAAELGKENILTIGGKMFDARTGEVQVCRW